MNLEQQAAEYIKKFEGYTSVAKWDVNAYRIGHGSDTIELLNGTHRKVVQGDSTTKALAQKDLERRLMIEFIPKIEKQIGAEYWKKIPQDAQVALLSLSYNYGSITKKSILDAARSGDMTKLSKALVDSTYNDNQKLSVAMREALRDRRSEEASMISQAKELVLKYPKISIGLVLVVVGLFGFAYAQYQYKIIKL